jgi:hypothetical protein
MGKHVSLISYILLCIMNTFTVYLLPTSPLINDGAAGAGIQHF